jgi:hypothetical protein
MEAKMRSLSPNRAAKRVAANTSPAANSSPAKGFDPAADSEVALLQRYLEAEFTPAKPAARLPLAISLPIVAATSVGLWVAIIAGVRSLL